MISEVILYSNGSVGVFDEEGQQISELQGSHIKTRNKLKKENTDNVKFYIGVHMRDIVQIPKEHFFCELWEEGDTNE